IEERCGQKQRTNILFDETKKASELAKTSGQDGKPSAALPVGYANLLTDLKARVRAAQLRAAVSVNRELILLYWDIGKIIVEAQNTKGYGKQVVEQLAEDLHTAFPKMDGFSPRNVWRMRAFYLAWTDESQKHQQPVGNLDSNILPQLVAELDGQNLPQAVAEIPWGHNVWLLEKISNPILRLWYAHKTIEHGWSRAVLTHHIETQLHKATVNRPIPTSNSRRRPMMSPSRPTLTIKVVMASR